MAGTAYARPGGGALFNLQSSGSGTQGRRQEEAFPGGCGHERARMFHVTGVTVPMCSTCPCVLKNTAMYLWLAGSPKAQAKTRAPPV